MSTVEKLPTYWCGSCFFTTDDGNQYADHIEDTGHKVPPGTPPGTVGNPGVIRTKRRTNEKGKKKAVYHFFGLPEYDVTPRDDGDEEA